MPPPEQTSVSEDPRKRRARPNRQGLLCCDKSPWVISGRPGTRKVANQPFLYFCLLRTFGSHPKHLSGRDKKIISREYFYARGNVGKYSSRFSPIIMHLFEAGDPAFWVEAAPESSPQITRTTRISRKNADRITSAISTLLRAKKPIGIEAARLTAPRRKKSCR